MHIALDIAQTCPERAGCGWYADGLSRALVRRGGGHHRFSLLHHFGRFINTATEAGTKIERIDAPLSSLDASQATQFWHDVESGSRRLPGEPEIVHASSFHAPRISGSRLVFTVHDVSFWVCPEFTTETNRLLCQRETLAALANASAFVFVSDATRSEFERILPGWLSETGILHRVIWPGTRFSSAQVRSTPPRDAPWLFVGTLEPRKNLLTLLDAHALYLQRSQQRRPLILAGGSGWHSESVRARLQANPSHVRWLGYVSDAELGELYRTSYALVLPSWYEGFGLPLAEAMAHGLPALCSERTSLPEVGGDAALYFDPASIDDIARQMLALEEPSTWAARSSASLARAPLFTWDRAADQTLAFYEEVLQRPPLHP